MTPQIIIIDDDDNIRLLYRNELKQEGYLVNTAASASEALEKLSTGEYHVAVLDIEMPDMSGLELLGKIREISPDTPVILNSAYSTYKSDFNSWMANAYVVKSSDLGPLKEKIKELLAYDE